VTSFAGYTSIDTIYTFNETTGILVFGNGVLGKIPPTGNTISINYVPDLNVYGKEVYELLWVKTMSSGVIQNPITIVNELGTKIDDTHIQIIHYPQLISVVGVWDNIAKTGTNYYTGGTFSISSGQITLGSTMPALTPYVEYAYQIQDDAEAGYSSIGKDTRHVLINMIPKNNAKILYLSVTVPSTASTEGGVYIRVRLRIYYNY
jgi:hypothetical protein